MNLELWTRPRFVWPRHSAVSRRRLNHRIQLMKSVIMRCYENDTASTSTKVCFAFVANEPLC